MSLLYWARLIIQILFKSSTVCGVLAETGAELALGLVVGAGLIPFLNIILISLIINIKGLNLPTILRLSEIQVSLVLGLHLLVGWAQSR
jgi:hypothetical protein